MNMHTRRAASTAKLLLTAASLSLSMTLAATAARADLGDCGVREEFCDNESMENVYATEGGAAGAGLDLYKVAPVIGAPTASVALAFDGVSQFDVAAFGRSFIPPDTMGAVGTTQYAEFVNGGFGLYSKATGANQTLVSDVAFWAAAGQTGANGDTRVMFNAAAQRWVALSFGSSVSDIQIAVTQGADASLGQWTSTKFTGFAGGTADYPTLAMDKNAVYIGTNDFNAAGSFAGTTLNVIPLSSVFSAGAPTTAGLKQFVTPYPADTSDRGFAIQGVNSSDNTTTGKVLAVSLFTTGLQRYNVLNAGTAGATETPIVHINDTYDSNGAGRQPNAVPDTCATATCSFPNNDRVIDTLDDRVGSSVYEVNGRIYSVHTVTPTGTDHTAIRYDVIDSATNAVLAQGDISDGTHDFYEGSLAVNANGDVVIGYNRSGSDPADGKIRVYAQGFTTNANGTLTAQGAALFLKESLVDDYHNGSLDGQIANGRQRWGDYSAVSLDPTDPTKFWVIGEYAKEYNDAAGGHPGGTGGSRWGTWIAEVNFSQLAAVPEPAIWAQMILGFGLIGGLMRRRSTKVTFA